MLWQYLFISTVLWASLQATGEVIRLPKDLKDLSERELRQIIAIAIENRCERNANEVAFTELKNSLFKFRCCMLENVRLPTSIKSDKTNTLDVFYTTSREVYKCLEALIKTAEVCLSLEEKYLPELFLKAHNATADMLSHNGGKKLEDTIATFQAAKCSPPIRHLPEQFFVTCAPKLDHLKALNVSDYILKQSDFCYDLRTAADCVVDSAKSQCNGDEGVVENIKELFKYFLSYCQDDMVVNNEITQVVFE